MSITQRRLTLAEINAIHREHAAAARDAGPQVNVDACVMAAFSIHPALWQATQEAERQSKRVDLLNRLAEKLGFALEPLTAEESDEPATVDADDQHGDDGDGAENANAEFAKMTKRELQAYAKENFGADLDMSQNKDALVSAVVALVDGSTQ